MLKWKYEIHQLLFFWRSRLLQMQLWNVIFLWDVLSIVRQLAIFVNLTVVSNLFPNPFLLTLNYSRVEKIFSHQISRCQRRSITRTSTKTTSTSTGMSCCPRWEKLIGLIFFWLRCLLRLLQSWCLRRTACPSKSGGTWVCSKAWGKNIFHLTSTPLFMSVSVSMDLLWSSCSYQRMWLHNTHVVRRHNY